MCQGTTLSRAVKLLKNNNSTLPKAGAHPAKREERSEKTLFLQDSNLRLLASDLLLSGATDLAIQSV